MNPPGAGPSPQGFQLPERTQALCNSCPLPCPRDMGNGIRFQWTGFLPGEELAYLGGDPVVLTELPDSVRGSLRDSHPMNTPIASDGT